MPVGTTIAALAAIALIALGLWFALGTADGAGASAVDSAGRIERTPTSAN